MKFNDYYNQSKAEDKKNGIKPPTPFIFRCDCIARKDKTHLKLEIFDMGDGDFEIAGVFLKKKSVNKLVNYLLGTGKPIIK